MADEQESQRRPVRVVELSKVTDDEVERVLNEMLDQGYELDTIHFAMHESSRRPTMAFLIFYDAFDPDATEDSEPPDRFD